MIKTAPIKGTAPRAPDAVDSPELRASAKDAAENVMIVDLMRNDLSRVCRPGTVQVDELLSVQPAPGRLASGVDGERASCSRGTSTADVLTATFPPGSVTGRAQDRRPARDSASWRRMIAAPTPARSAWSARAPAPS